MGVDPGATLHLFKGRLDAAWQWEVEALRRTKLAFGGALQWADVVVLARDRITN